MFFNVFEAAPENERDGPSQQAAQNASGKACATKLLELYLADTYVQLPEYFL
jgi:hypothetical protein